jgi:hypothetical protein
LLNMHYANACRYVRLTQRLFKFTHFPVFQNYEMFLKLLKPFTWLVPKRSCQKHNNNQEYKRRLRNSAFFSLQQQFLCMQNSYPIVTFCFFYMEFAGYHWLNVSCVPLYIPLIITTKKIELYYLYWEGYGSTVGPKSIAVDRYEVSSGSRYAVKHLKNQLSNRLVHARPYYLEI